MILKASSNFIPDEFFDAVAFLVPYLNRVARKDCGLSIGSLFVMTHLQLSGEKLERPTMLRKQLTDLLQYRGFSPAGVSRLMRELELKGLVQRTFIPVEVRQAKFEHSGRTNTQAIVLTEAGEQKIKDFKRALRAHFDHWIASESSRSSSARDWLPWLIKLLGTTPMRKHFLSLSHSLIERIKVSQSPSPKHQVTGVVKTKTLVQATPRVKHEA